MSRSEIIQLIEDNTTQYTSRQLEAMQIEELKDIYCDIFGWDLMDEEIV